MHAPVLPDHYRRKTYLTAFLLAAVIFAGANFLRIFLLGLPSIFGLEDYTPLLTTRVYDMRDELIAEFSIERRALLPLYRIRWTCRTAS